MPLARCPAQSTKTPWELLAPMREYCLYRPTGWWTYELCYGTHVKQFHDDAERKQPRVEFLLGVPPAAADGADDAPVHTEATDAHGNRYYSEWYLDGTVCDLTNEPRKTEIRFTCDATKAEHIAVLKETSTCQYLLVVQTPRLCTHPLYRPREGVALPIQCQQVLSDAEWAEYVSSGGGAVHAAPVRAAAGPRNEPSVERGIVRSRATARAGLGLGAAATQLSHIHTRGEEGVVGLNFKVATTTATTAATAPAAQKQAAPAAAAGGSAGKASAPAGSQPPAAEAPAGGKREAIVAEEEEEEDLEHLFNMEPLALTASMLAGDRGALRALLKELRAAMRLARQQEGQERQAAAAGAAEEDDDVVLENEFVLRLGNTRFSYRIISTESAAATTPDEDEDGDDSDSGAKGGQPAGGPRAAKARM